MVTSISNVLGTRGNADTQKFCKVTSPNYPYVISSIHVHRRSSSLQKWRQCWHAEILQSHVRIKLAVAIYRRSISDPLEPHSMAEISLWDRILSRLGLLIKQKPTVNTRWHKKKFHREYQVAYIWYQNYQALFTVKIHHSVYAIWSQNISISSILVQILKASNYLNFANLFREFHLLLHENPLVWLDTAWSGPAPGGWETQLQLAFRGRLYASIV